MSLLCNRHAIPLTGKDEKIRASINREMEQAAEQQEYERAARVRDRLRALASITSEQNVNLEPVDNADLFALAKSGARVCVQVFFFRGGRNYGNRACFPQGTEGTGRSPDLVRNHCSVLRKGTTTATGVGIARAKQS